MSHEERTDPDKAVPEGLLELGHPDWAVELLPDGRLKVPSTEARQLLRERLRSARLFPTSSGWVLAQTRGLPETRRAAALEPQVVAAGAIGGAAIPFIDFIGFLAASYQTGVLTVNVQDAHRSVFFHSGDVVWAVSSAEEDRLGEFLRRRGKITGEQLQIALRDGSKKIGRVCVERGFISAHELWVMVQGQLTEIFDKMVATETGLWTFARLDAEMLEKSQIHLSTQGLLVDALRRLDELKVYRTQIRSADVLVQVRSDVNIDQAVSRVPKEEQTAAKNLLENHRVAATILDLMRILGRGEFEVTRLVYHLTKAGAMEVVQGSETGPIPRRQVPTQKDARDIVHIYGMAMREMFDAVGKIGRSDELHASASAYLDDPTTDYHTILRAAKLDGEGRFQEESLLGTVLQQGVSAESLQDALNELLFFVLFQATDYLGREQGDDLARRVKLVIGMLAGTRPPSAAGAGPL